MIEINEDTAEAMADAASLITGGAVAMAQRANAGDGWRFIDAHQVLSFYGRDAAVRATAYYAGAIRAYWKHGSGAHRALIDEWAARDADLFECYVWLWRGPVGNIPTVEAWKDGYSDGTVRVHRAIQAS